LDDVTATHHYTAGRGAGILELWIIVLVVLLVLFGGGGYYVGRTGFGGTGPVLPSILYTIAVIALIVLALRLLGIL
jgi:hypothetical protein